MIVEVERTGIEPATSWLQIKTYHKPITSICRTSEGNRASELVSESNEIGLCGEKLTL